MESSNQTPVEVLEAIGAAATMSSALAGLLAIKLDRPDIVQDFTKLLHRMHQEPDVSPIAAAVYRMASESLARFE